MLVAVVISYLALLPESPHGDGIELAATLLRDELRLNPNHLLMQPIVLWAYRSLTGLGVDVDPLLLQKWLSVVAAGITLVVVMATLRAARVRLGLRITLLLLIAFSFNFLHLATSDHVKLITGPFLALALYGATRYSAVEATGPLVGAGVAVAVAILTLVNAAIWAALLGLFFLWATSGGPARRLRAGAVYALAVGVPTSVGFYLGWSFSDTELDPPTWITTYGSDPGSAGFWAPTPLIVARAGFAFLKNFAYSDAIGPAVKALLTGQSTSSVDGDVRLVVTLVATALTAALVIAAIGWLVRSWKDLERYDRRLLALGASAIAAFGGFALFWNSGEEDFWFQTTFGVIVILAVLAQEGPALRRAAVTGITGVLIFSNVFSFSIPRRQYPHDLYVAEVSETVDVEDVVVFSGGDPLAGIFFDVERRRPITAVSITTVLRRNSFSLEATLDTVDLHVAQARARGGDLWVVRTLEPARDQYPWTYLGESFGIEPDPFVELLLSKGRPTSLTLAGHPAWRIELSGVGRAKPPDDGGALNGLADSRNVMRGNDLVLPEMDRPG